MRLCLNAFKGSSEEVEKALDVSLSHIDTYLFYGEITLIIGQKNKSDDGGVMESLAGEPPKNVRICVFYSNFNCCLNFQYKALQ